MSHATEPSPVPASTRQPVTPAFLERQLARSMDATVLNRRQYDPSPEIDSDLERALEALDRGDRAETRKWIRSAMAANVAEGERQLKISGDIDRAATDARSIAATGSTVKAPNTRQLVAMLRRPLGVLAFEGQSPAAVDAAGVEVDRIIQTTPRHRLLSASVLHNLGKAKARVLIERAGA